YAITGNGFILEDSLLPNKTVRKRPFREVIPSFTEFQRFKRSPSPDNIIKLDRVISVRHLWEWNYYHFYLDVLGKLDLFDAVGLNSNIPVVVGDYFNDVAFARQITSTGELSGTRWIIPCRKYVLANEVYYCKTTRNYRDRLDYVLDRMHVQGDSGRLERLFLHRGRASTRNIENLSEVTALLDEYGFKPVDATDLPVSEQIALFQGARFVVSIHGAGNTNIIYRRGQPLGLLELHASSFLKHDHQRISQEYGYTWDHLPCESVGNATPQRAVR